MVKAKRHAKHFIDWLFAVYHVPRIPVIIKWHHTALVLDDGRACFGAYMVKAGKIYVAAGQIGTSGACSVIGHEFVHYLQELHDRDMENDNLDDEADFYGAALYGIYLVNKSGLDEKITNMPAVWEPRQEATQWK